MSDHADTIRRALSHPQMHNDWPLVRSSALGSLDALLAENQRLRDALETEALMLRQSVKTLREMRSDWRDLIEEFEGAYLIEQYLDTLIEDLDQADAIAALAAVRVEDE